MFTPEMTVDEALARHPMVKWALAAKHIGGCGECAIAGSTTLEAAAAHAGIPTEKLIAVLNELEEAKST